MDVGKFAKTLGDIVLRRIEQDKLSLPGMPEVAQRCTKLLSAEEPDLPALGREVELDPLIAAEVLRRANSAAAGGAVKITSVPQAVSRVGVAGMKSLMVQVSARQLFHSADARIKLAFRGLWEHSVAVGVLSQTLASELPSVDADLAYQAGLMHDLGKPIVGVMLLEAEKMAPSATRKPRSWMTSDQWMEIVNRLHRAVGAALAEKWGMDEMVCAAVRSDQYDDEDYGSLPNLVRFANNLAKRLGLYPSKCALSELEPLLKTGRLLCGIDPDALEMVTADIRDQIAERVA